MTHIFVILGRSHSYKDFIYNHCKCNPALNCTTAEDIAQDKINIIIGSVEYCKQGRTYSAELHPIFVHTPEEQVIKSGLDYWDRNGRKYDTMCRTYIEESAVYTDVNLDEIGAIRVKADNACDACYDFMTHVKEVLARHPV